MQESQSRTGDESIPIEIQVFQELAFVEDSPDPAQSSWASTKPGQRS